jgi:endoglucanase
MKALYQEGEIGRVVTSIQSDKWEEGTTWNCGRLPTILNQTIIQNGHIVNLSTTNYTKYLTLNGSLEFKVGGNLTTSQ